MNIKKACVTLLILIFLVNGLYAQGRQFPYELKKRDFLLLPLGIGLSFYSESLTENVNPLTLEEIKALDRNDVNGFDRSATYNWSLKWADRSDHYLNILAFQAFLSCIPPMFHGKFSNSVTVATMLLESDFLLRCITYLTKAVTLRKRPYLYNTTLSIEDRFGGGEEALFSFYSIEDRFGGGEEALFSFYSGHTAAAFFSATFLSKVVTDIYGDSIWTKALCGSSLTLASLTGYARVKAGKHYPTDVIVGAVVGSAVGYLVPTLHKKKTGDQLSIIISHNQIGLCFLF